ncbi:Asp-tRNA(Asn)/Glu-tRNA(Gln) amidotransferase subunit GatA, partial [Candidatus Dojkabacteria bacterium]|nr:Asp-tRNA(Asn)/Glu-tRNA(Gln) amidotransferase subunit GatA [Candidatus Dojkabacteria bacterium]
MSDLYGKTVVELRQLIGRGEVSSDEITSFFKNRIETLNKKLNAFLTINPAESSAEAIPIAIKDNFCTKGLRTTASSKVLDNYIPPYESTVTQKTQSSGFYTLGKTNMDAWAHGSSTETSAYGPTLNPWDLDRVPGGSSGGSAAAVSAYLVPAAIGSETAGSIRLPAAWCGVVGMKPTYGRVSRYGVIAMGSSWDCPGTLTLSVEDAALILGKIAGKDPYDATSIDAPVD